MQITIPSHLTDTALIAAVKRFADGEREATAQLIAHLAELDARRLYEGAGYSSMFTYCCGVLHLSEDAAYNRIETARAAHKFPAILAGLAEGALNVTTVRLLARRLTPENHAALLAAASGRSKREVEELVARNYPQPDVPSSVRKLPTRPAEELALKIVPSEPAPRAPLPVAGPSPTQRPTIAPIAEDRYLVKFTASAATQKKLKIAQDLLRHANPSGDLGEVVDRALTLLIADLERKKFAAVKQPRKSRGVAEGSRNSPAPVRRHAARRDDKSCGFVGTGGHRCGETAFLEFNHFEAFAGGGKATTRNIELRCRAHNRYEAELYFSGTVNLESVQHGPERVGHVKSADAPRPPVARAQEQPT
jgi:hypothetical protein